MNRKLLQFVLQSFILLMTAATCLDLRAEINPSALDPNSIIGIEAIVAAASDGAFYSRFGHAMLRFVKADGDFTTDVVVSLEADVPANQVNAMKGLDGGYKMVPTLDTFGDFWVKYVMTEERPLQRFIIPTTPAMRTRLIETLQGWVQNPVLAGNYTFLNNNCVGGLARLLEKAGFPKTIGPNPIIPTHLDNWLQHSFLSFYPALEMQSPKSLYERAAVLLSTTAPDLIIGQNWPKNAADILNSNLSDLEIKRLLLELNHMPYFARAALVKLHNFGNGGADLEQAMAYQSAPANLYQTCADLACMGGVVNEVRQLWSTAALKKSVSSARFVYGLVVNSEAGDDLNQIQSDIEMYNEPISSFPNNLSLSPDLIRNTQLFLRTVL